jgi:hypothetical protein
MDGRLLVTAKSIEFEIKAKKGFGHWQKTIQAEKKIIGKSTNKSRALLTRNKSIIGDVLSIQCGRLSGTDVWTGGGLMRLLQRAERRHHAANSSSSSSTPFFISTTALDTRPKSPQFTLGGETFQDPDDGYS